MTVVQNLGNERMTKAVTLWRDLVYRHIYCTNIDSVATETIRFLFVLLRHNITQQYIFKMLPWKQQWLLFELLTHVCQKYKINTSFATETQQRLLL